MASGMKREQRQNGLMEPCHTNNDYESRDVRSPSPPTHSWPLTHSHRSQVRSCIEFSPTDVKTPVSESHAGIGGPIRRRVSNPFLLDFALVANNGDEGLEEDEVDQQDFSTSNSLSLLSNEEEDDDDDDTLSSTGTLSEVFESLSRFSEVCLASVEALCSPQDGIVTTPRASYPFDGNLSSEMVPRCRGSAEDMFLVLPDPSSMETHPLGLPSSSSALHQRQYPRAEKGAGRRVWSDYGSGSEAGGPNTQSQCNSCTSQSSNNVPGLGIGVGELSYNMLDSNKPPQRGHLLPRALPYLHQPRHQQASGQGPSETHLMLLHEENAILSLLAELPQPHVTCLDWQERCMELEVALQRFGEQAARVRLFLRDKVRNFSISLSFIFNSFPKVYCSYKY